jgi:hypothetical protein
MSYKFLSVSFSCFVFLFLKISSLAPYAPAPIIKDGKIPIDNPIYGIAKKVPPQSC